MWCTKILERNFGECMYVVVDTEYHHQVLSDGGLGVVFVVDFLRWLVFGLLVR